MSDERSMENGARGQVFSHALCYAPLVPFVLAAMEAVLLALIVLTPWAYGAVHPHFEFLLDAGIALLMALWAARMLLERQVTWKTSTVAICLASLFLLGIWQQTPLSRSTLAWLSPGTVRCYDELLPSQPETLPNDMANSDIGSRPGSTLSLYPGATQRESLRLLAVLLVFVVVYNNLASKETLIRLSWVALLNGSLLSLFALFQLFSAPPYTVYWIYSAQTTPFGPFICHNHFPDYVNMCIGLGVGLLVSGKSRDLSSTSLGEDASPLQLLRSPRALWICSALGLMLTAVAFSRSRGGLLALVVAAVICGLLGRWRLGRSFRLGPGLVVASVVVGLCAWFGIDLVKNRLATLGTGEALESRVPLWLRSLPIVRDFPVWGTGYGTFDYIEPMYRPDVASPEGLLVFRYYHAHNDYLEILIEGGAIGLGLVVIALIAVYRRGFRALSENRGSRRTGLALGALFAFTALALHSFGDFGAHTPAITLLGTVVAAQLCALGPSARRRARSLHKDVEHSFASVSVSTSYENDFEGDSYRFRFGGVAPLLGAIVALSLGVLICADTWKAHRIDRLRSAALLTSDAEADQLRTRIACLNEAVSLGPENAELYSELGIAHGRLAELLMVGDPLDRRMRGEPPDPPVLRERASAVHEYLRARDDCPLLFSAQLGVAGFARGLKQGDAAESYVHRAKLLCPGQVEAWYKCGWCELGLLRFEDAWASWRHCLELSDYYLPRILSNVSRFPISAELMMKKILPDDPDILLQSALQLYPDFGSLQRRRPFLEKALHLVEAKEDGGEPKDLLVRARIYKALEKTEQAIHFYKEFLNRDGSQVTVRYELAGYLRELHKLEEAQRELTVIVAQDRKNNQAKEMLDAVSKEMLQAKDVERKQKQDDWWRAHRRP